MANAHHTLTSLFTDIESCAARLHNKKGTTQEIGFLKFACNDFSGRINELTMSNIATLFERYLEVQEEKIDLPAYQDANKRVNAEDLIELLDVFKKNWSEMHFQSKIELIADFQAKIQTALKGKKHGANDAFTMPEFFVQIAPSHENTKNLAEKNTEVDPFDVAHHDMLLWTVKKIGSTYLEIDCIILFVVSGEILMSRWSDSDSNNIDAWSAVDFNECFYNGDKVFFFLHKKDALAKVASMIEISPRVTTVWMALNRLHQAHVDWESESMGTTR